jgi:hypothetical protein
MTGWKISGALLLIWGGFACAQEIPSGTALPVYLNTAVDADKAQAGQAISGVVAQDVPLPSGTIRAGSRVNGRVLQAGMKSDRNAYVRLRFDQIRVNGRDIAITTSLRALASPWEVDEAHLPKVGPVERDPSASLITVQVGGEDVVYRGGGHVMHDVKVVGDPVKDGVLAELLSVPHPGCEAESGGRRLALWVFSSSACGAYGFRRFEVVHAGTTAPFGEIVLQAKKHVRLRTGSALLLITAEAPSVNP